MMQILNRIYDAMRSGRVVRAIDCGTEDRRFKSRSGQTTGKLSLFTQQRIVTRLISEKVKGGERRGSHALLKTRWGSNIPLRRRQLGYGHLHLYIIETIKTIFTLSQVFLF